MIYGPFPGVAEPRLGEYLAVKEGVDFSVAAQHTLHSREGAGNIPVHQHPPNNYRLFKISDLEKLLVRVEQSSKCPTREGRRPAKAK